MLPVVSQLEVRGRAALHNLQPDPHRGERLQMSPLLLQAVPSDQHGRLVIPDLEVTSNPGHHQPDGSGPAEAVEPNDEFEEARSPGHGAWGPWTPEEWQEWHQRRRWWHDDSSTQQTLEEEEIEIQCEQFDHSNEQILPEEILGWLLLRRSGLPAHARLSVLSAVNNQLDVSTMERAMRDQEEELLMAESHRGFHPSSRPRRSFWIEQDAQWGLLAEQHLEEEISETDICWVGDRLPQEVYATDTGNSKHDGAWSTWMPDGTELQWEWMEDDFYSQDQQGCFWSWTETKPWMGLEHALAAAGSAEVSQEAQQLQEAYAQFQERYRSFQDSRALNNAKHLSRGFYPFSMIKGKQKGKPKGKGKSKTNSPVGKSSSPPTVAFGKGSGSSQRPGNPEYKGCFVCGAKDHEFRNCPKRVQKPAAQPSGPAKPSFYARSVFMVSEVDGTAADHLGDHDPAEALALLTHEFPGHAVID